MKYYNDPTLGNGEIIRLLRIIADAVCAHRNQIQAADDPDWRYCNDCERFIPVTKQGG